jgi:hypothetical protein
MRRLSSSFTFFYKRVFPIFWFGFVLVFLLVTLVNPGPHGSQALPFLVVPVLMLVIGFVVMRKLVFDLVDEVWLDGDSLLVKNRQQEARIALADVINVNCTVLTNPRRITLRLRTDSRFGRDVTFMPNSPRGLFTAFRSDPVADELIQRADAARQGRR